MTDDVKKLQKDRETYLTPKERHSWRDWDIWYSHVVQEKTFAEIGRLYGLSRQRIHQICIEQQRLRQVEMEI